VTEAEGKAWVQANRNLRRSKMNVKELKREVEFLQDALYQKGYDLGFESLLEEFEQIADSWHNNSFTAPAEMLRLEIRKLRSEN
jgi:hypothetical protein